MKKLILVPLLIVGLLLSAMGGLAFAQTPEKAQGHAPDQILVKFLPGTSESAKADVHKKLGGEVVGVIPGIDVQVVRIPENKVEEKVKGYKGEAIVEFAEPDYVAEAILTPNDPYFGKQWGMVKIQAPQAWDTARGSPTVKIAVCDTGIDQNHEDLAAKIVANKNFTTSRTVDDNYGHGTHVAGIAAAITNNEKGVAGVGFDSSLMNVKVLGDTGTGYYSWVANGIIWAADNGAKVINLSLGGTSASSTLELAVNDAWGKGCVLVAAAGNANTSAPLYPAYYANCIAVAATDQSDVKANFSTYGNWVDVAAPGVDIFSTLPNHTNKIGVLNYGSLSGTSMSTPHVAGLAGLVWATAYGTNNTGVRNRIESTADAIAGTGTYWQYGRINAYKAVAPAAPQPPTLSVIVSAPGLTNQTSFTVQATVTNSGDVTATGVTATITLPLGLSTAESLTKLLGDIAGKASAPASWLVTAKTDGQYTITVDAAATNTSPASGTAMVTVDTTRPAQVTGVTVTTVSSSQLDLSWNANTEPDLAHYNVYRGTVSGTYTLIASPKVNSYADTGLAAASTYYYVVSAVDAAENEGTPSVEASGTTSEAVAGTMSVASITFSAKKAGPNLTLYTTVKVVLENGSPVSSARVEMTLTHESGSSWNFAFDTGSAGTVQFTLLKAPTGRYTAKVTKVSHTNYAWDSVQATASCTLNADGTVTSP